MGSFPLTSDPIEQLRARHLAEPPRAKSLPLGLPIDARLPDAGLPRGAVVELASASGLGHATRLALAACGSAQHEASARAGVAAEGAWCCWIDTSATLYAPGVVQAGVALERLLVVRPAPEAVSRTAVRLATSHLFAVLVVDRAGVPGALAASPRQRWSIIARRLALAVEGSDCTVVLLSSLAQAQVEPLPVAMRLELCRPSRESWQLRVAKERYGRIGAPLVFAAGGATRTVNS